MAAKTLQEFTSELRNRNIARPNLYHVSMGIPPKMSNRPDSVSLVSMWCSSAATPDVQMLTNDNYVEDGIRRKYAYDYDYTDLTLTFYIDQGYDIKMFFDDWMKAIVPYKRKFSYPDDYVAESVTLTIINQDDKDTFQYKFKRIFPKSITPVDLNYYSGSTFSTFSVNFVYEDFSYTQFNPDNNVQKYTSEINTGPSQQTGGVVSGLEDFLVSPSLPTYVVTPNRRNTAIGNLSSTFPSILGNFMSGSLPTILSGALTGQLNSAITAVIGNMAGNGLQNIISENFPEFNAIIMQNLPPMEAIIAAHLPAYGNSVTNIPRLLKDKMPDIIKNVAISKLPQIIEIVKQNLPDLP